MLIPVRENLYLEVDTKKWLSNPCIYSSNLAKAKCHSDLSMVLTS